MKKYIVEFIHTNGKIEEVEFVTDRIEWSIDQWCRNRFVSGHKILSESSISSKKMLLD